MLSGSLPASGGVLVHEFEKKSGYLEYKKKPRHTANTPLNPHQPSDRDHLETDRDETRSARLPMFARFNRSRVCGSRPRTALAIGKNDECHTHIINTSYQKLPFGSGDYPAKLLYHQALN